MPKSRKEPTWKEPEDITFLLGDSLEISDEFGGVAHILIKRIAKKYGRPPIVTLELRFRDERERSDEAIEVLLAHGWRLKWAITSRIESK